MKSLNERLESIYILKVAVDFGMAVIKPLDGRIYFENFLNKEEKTIVESVS